MANDRDTHTLKQRTRRNERVSKAQCADCNGPLAKGDQYRCEACREKRRVKPTVDPITVYDLFCKFVKEPAVLKLGDRFIAGEWVSIGELKGTVVCRGEKKAIQVICEGTSWGDVMSQLEKANTRWVR